MELEKEQETFVYGTLMTTLGKYIATVKTTNEAYAALVAESISGLVVLLSAELKAQTNTCESLCDAMRPIFNT